PARPAWKVLLRPRTIVYFSVWGAIGLALLFALGTRSHTDISVAPDRNPPYMLMSDGSVRNAYTVKLRNMQSRPRQMKVAIAGLPGAAMWSDEMGRDAAARELIFTVPADSTAPQRLYLVAPAGTPAQDFACTVTSLDDQRETDAAETRFSAPGEGQ